MNESPADGPSLDPSEDEVEVLRAFLNSGVRFLVVGGRAVQFYEHTRSTKDLDLLVEFAPENWQKLEVAMGSLNDKVHPFEDLSQSGKHQGRLFDHEIGAYRNVELLTAIDGVSFSEAWSESNEGTFAGLRVRVISKGHLILSKQDTGRPTDADDIKRLQGICLNNARSASTPRRSQPHAKRG